MCMSRTDIQLYFEKIPTSEVEAFVQDPSCGAVVTFVGNVRDHTADKEVLRLEFEAYEPMALKELQKIADQVLSRWPVKRIAIHHRLGNLKIGDAAVVISASAPHRTAAFEACQFAIDTLKQTVPIWKKEIFVDGEVWVAAHP